MFRDHLNTKGERIIIELIIEIKEIFKLNFKAKNEIKKTTIPKPTFKA